MKSSDRALPMCAVTIIIAMLGLWLHQPQNTSAPLPIRAHTQQHAAFDGAKIDVNKASVTDLLQIPKMTRRTAQAIIDAREKIGPFKSYDALNAVKGVGEKTLQRLKEHVVLK